MATIGSNATGANQALTAGSAYMHNLPLYQYVATVQQNVDAVYIYSSNASNSGLSVEVSLYEISSGTRNLVANTTQTFVTDSSTGWKAIDLTGLGITINPGTYAVGIWSAGAFACMTKTVVNDDNMHVRNSSQTASPDPLVDSLNNNIKGGPLSAYFTTTNSSLIAPVISDVNGGSSITTGDNNVLIALTGGEASQGNGSVVISLSDNINDASVITQVIGSSGWSDTAVYIDINLPTGAGGVPVFVFITNNSGASSVSGFSVNVTPIAAAVFHTLQITDDGTVTGNPVICASSDFSAGVTAYKNKGLLSEEFDDEVISLSTGDTDRPEYNVRFPTGAPIGGDTITFVYDQTLGDIQSVADGIALLSGEFPGTVC